MYDINKDLNIERLTPRILNRIQIELKANPFRKPDIFDLTNVVNAVGALQHLEQFKLSIFVDQLTFKISWNLHNGRYTSINNIHDIKLDVTSATFIRFNSRIPLPLGRG